MRRASRHELRDGYRVRLLTAMAVVLALACGLVRFWPPPSEDGETARVYASDGEPIEIQDIRPTSQSAAQEPPPPAPLPPVEVPNDVVLEEPDLNFEAFTSAFDEMPPEDAGPPGEDQAAQAPPQADVGPRPVRFVEPEYTSAARRQNMRARVLVRVLVSPTGEVTEATVTERFLLGEDVTTREPVAHLGHGLEEAALSAARRWLFRPARENGQAVESYTTLTFSFGVDS